MRSLLTISFSVSLLNELTDAAQRNTAIQRLQDYVFAVGRYQNMPAVSCFEGFQARVTIKGVFQCLLDVFSRDQHSNLGGVVHLRKCATHFGSGWRGNSRSSRWNWS